MNKKISGIGAALSMLVCIAGEIVFSGAMKNVFAVAGNGAFLCFAVSSVAIIALAPAFLRMSPGVISAAVSTVYLLPVLSRLAQSMTLFQSKATLVAVLVCVAALCVLSFGVKTKGAALFTALSFIPVAGVFVLCLLLGWGEYDLQNALPVVSNGFGSLMLGTLNSFSVLFPLLLPLIYIDTQNRKTGLIGLSSCLAGITLSAALGVFAFGLTASDYQSVTAEISKNVSVGKFFQRLEGPADIAYILSAICAITLLGAMAGGGVSGKIKFNVSLCLFSSTVAVITVVSFLSVMYEPAFRLTQTVAAVTGCGLLFFVPKWFGNFKRVAPAAIALCLLLCSCGGQETERVDYVVAASYDSRSQTVYFATERGDGGHFYALTAQDFDAARQAAERKYNIALSFKQLGAVMFDVDCPNIHNRIKEMIQSELPNSAVLCFFDCDFRDLYDEQIKSYSSAFDFVSAVKSGAEGSDSVVRNLSKINQMLSTPSALASAGVIGQEGYDGCLIFDRDGGLVRLDSEDSVIYNGMLDINYTVDVFGSEMCCDITVSGFKTERQMQIADYIYNVAGCDGLYLNDVIKNVNRAYSHTYSFELTKK